jgi:hypothetical protein
MLHYFRGWLCLDLVASFPFDWVIILHDRNEDRQYSFTEQSEGLEDWIPIFWGLMLLKVFRLLKLNVIIGKLVDRLTS